MIKKNISSYLNLYFQEEMKFLQKEIYPYTTRMDHSTKKYRCMNIEKKNLISLIEALFWKENYKFLYKIFGIMPVRKDVKLLFDDLPEPNANREVEGIVLEKVKGFKFISSINGLDVKCKMYSTGESVEEQCKMRINIISVDNLKNNIVCHVRMKINDNIEIREIMESTDVRLICEIYGVEREMEYPVWLECLLLSYVFFEINDERMAFFIAFAALDQLIERLYSRLPLIYRTAYFENGSNLVEEEASVFEAKREKYTNVNRRLIEEKLHDILVERFEDTKKYSSPYSKIKEYEKIRNKIAHGESAEVRGKYLDLLLNIIKIIYLMGLGENITKILKEIK